MCSGLHCSFASASFDFAQLLSDQIKHGTKTARSPNSFAALVVFNGCAVRQSEESLGFGRNAVQCDGNQFFPAS